MDPVITASEVCFRPAPGLDGNDEIRFASHTFSRICPGRFGIIQTKLLLVAFAISANATAQDLGERIDAYLKPFVDGKNFSGSVLVAKKGKVVVSKGYGMANYELQVPNTVQTRYHVASISKAFTATAILLLQQRRQLNLNNALIEYVPDFPNGDKIRLRHLLTHTSGITDVNGLPEYQTASRSPQTPKSLIELFKRKPLDFAPGASYGYSNSNYNLLAYVIESSSKRSYGQFLRENIFTPLHMSATGHDEDAAAIIPDRASGYAPYGIDELVNAPYLDWSSKTGNGSLISTIEDLLKFDRAFFANKLLPGGTLSNILVEKPGNNFGWFVRKSHGRLAAATNGRSPGFTSSLEHFLDDDVVVIVLANTYSSATQSPIAADIASLALGEEVTLPKAITRVSLSAKEAESYAGEYKFGGDFYRANAVVKLLLRKDTMFIDWGNGSGVALVPVAKGEFLDRQFWARLKINPDGAGFTYVTDREFQAKRIRRD